MVEPRKKVRSIKTVLGAGLFAGILDAIAAILIYLYSGGKNINRVFQYIASAIFGKAAFSGGLLMVLYGIIFHLLIACSFAMFFFLLYPRLKILSRHPVFSGLLYGVLIWMFMNLILLPITRVTQAPFHFMQSIVGMIVVMFLVGLPISLIIHSGNRQ